MRDAPLPSHRPTLHSGTPPVGMHGSVSGSLPTTQVPWLHMGLVWHGPGEVSAVHVRVSSGTFPHAPAQQGSDNDPIPRTLHASETALEGTDASEGLGRSRA